MVFSKQFPISVENDIPVYKVVKIIDDKIYSPYYEEKKIIDINGAVAYSPYKITNVTLSDVCDGVPFTQLAESLDYNTPTSISYVDNLTKQVIKTEYVSTIPELLETTMSDGRKRYTLGIYCYTKGFVFSYGSLSDARNAAQLIKERNESGDIDKVAILSGIIPINYDVYLGGKLEQTNPNIFVSSFVKTTSIASKAITINGYVESV